MLTNMNMTLILTQQRDDIAYQRLVATMCSRPSLVATPYLFPLVWWCIETTSSSEKNKKSGC